MNKEDNIFLLTAIIAIILLLFAVVSMYITKEREKDARINLQKQVDMLVVQKDGLESRLKETEALQAKALSDIRVQEEKIASLSKALEEEKASNASNVSKIQEKEFELRHIKMKVDEVTAEKKAAMSDMENMNERLLSMKFQLENLLKTKEEMEKKAKEIADQEGVSLGTVVIKRTVS